MKLFSGNAAGNSFRARERRSRTGDEQEPYLSISRLVIFPVKKKGFYGFFVDKLYGRIISRLQIIVAIKIIVTLK